MNEDSDLLHLSLLTLSPRSREARNDLRDPYELHRTLSKAFPESGDSDDGNRWEAARCLFRIEEFRVLVQSRGAEPPDWIRLTTPPDYLTNAPVVRAWRPRFTSGRTLAFRLRANPTVKRDGKRIGLLLESERDRWLARKMEAAGCALVTATQRDDDPQFSHTARGNRATLCAVQFDGLLRVGPDPALLAEAVASGVGSAKGFGFGLLSLSRPK